MAVLNPPGYLHNASPAVASGQMDRLIGIVANVAADGAGLSVSEGVRSYNELRVSAQATPNMTVSVSGGIAIVKGTQNATQGAYVFMNDGPVNLAIPAANATNPRWDLVVARIYDSQYSGTADTSALEVIAGTPSATPIDPVLPANSLVLGRVVVAANDTAIGDGDTIDLRKFTAAPGGTVPVQDAAQRDALVKYPGLTVYRIDTQTLETWNAITSAWNSQTTTTGTTGITAATGWSITSQTWTKKNGMFIFYLQATRTGATINSGSTGNISNVAVATIPAGSRPVQEVGIQAGRTGRMILGTCDSAGTVRITSTVPNVDIANNDSISLTGMWAL